MSPLFISLFVIVVTAALIGFDIYLMKDDIKANTYSARVHAWGRRWAWFPLALSFSLGVLCGHWFLSDWQDAGSFWSSPSVSDAG